LKEQSHIPMSACHPRSG